MILLSEGSEGSVLTAAGRVSLCFRSMVGQISSHEEQAAELTDRIAVMEEELKRVREAESVVPRTCLEHLRTRL